MSPEDTRSPERAVSPERNRSESFWRGRRVLVTGHTGFKGAWLCLWLQSCGARVTGYALPPATTPNLFELVHEGIESIEGDVRDIDRLREVTIQSDPQVVFHLAAQALVRESYRDPLGTYATNVLGTAGLLEASRAARRLECVLIITSDKVYAQDGQGRAFSEGDRLGGHDPYSSSKACAELVTASYRDSFMAAGPPVASARAGNVIGGGDWSPDRLIPDCVRALAAGRSVALRYPRAVRPWQHVLEPLSGYLALARALIERPQEAPRAVNFGPAPASFCRVHEVVDAFSQCFAGRPGWVEDPDPQPPEAQVLTLSSALAERALGWRPRLDIDEALAWTADWYRAQAAGEDVRALSLAQIARYQAWGKAA